SRRSLLAAWSRLLRGSLCPVRPRSGARRLRGRSPLLGCPLGRCLLCRRFGPSHSRSSSLWLFGRDLWLLLDHRLYGCHLGRLTTLIGVFAAAFAAAGAGALVLPLGRPPLRAN